jgi:ankyrin repeat protein
MQLQKEYEGIRVQFEGCLGRAKIPMQIDIGFGDVVTPCAEERQYPSLLGLPEPQIKMYPQETLISEKILTMVEKGDSNSRIKDFYDVWLLFRQNQFSYDVLKLALERTAEARKIKYDFEIIRTVMDRYSKNPQTKILWESFKRNKIPEVYLDLSFDILVSDIIDGLKKIEKDSDEKLYSILQRMIQGKLKGEFLYDVFEKVLSKEKDINKQNINGHGILQLLIEKARLSKRKKLELIKKVVDCGAKVDVVDRSGLTPFQIAVKNRDKVIANYFLSKGARDKVPINMYADYYHLYRR